MGILRFYFTAAIILFSFVSNSSFGEEVNTAKTEALEKISEFVHPHIAEIWKNFFSNFDQDKIVSWNFSEKTGQFSMTLKSPLKFWIPASKNATSEPRPGSILIFGMNNKVEGRLNQQKKSIEFSKGFNIFCKYKIGFFTVPIMVDVYSFTYKNRDVIILEAGKGGIAEKRSKSLDKYLNSWSEPNHVVLGDYEAYLNLKSK